MQRPVVLPLWAVILIVAMPFLNLTVVPYVQELYRDYAVEDVKDAQTIEHNELGHIIIDSVKTDLDARRAERTNEHNMIAQKAIENANNNTEKILAAINNGTG